MATKQPTSRDFTIELRKFRTMNQRDTPITMQEDELPFCQNYMPIGTSLWTVPGYSAILATLGNSEAAWTANTAYAVNDVVKPTVSNGCIYKCTVAGTSHASTEPTWVTTQDTTLTDGGVTWKCYRLDILRLFDLNLSGTVYKIVVCGGSTNNSVTLYWLSTSNWSQGRLNIPGGTSQSFTNPKFAQWQNTKLLIEDTVGGYFNYDGSYKPMTVAGTAIATTKTKVKTANVIQYIIGTANYRKAITNNLWTLTGFNCTNAKYNKCYLYLDNAGAASIGAGTEAATADAVVLPAIDTTKCLVALLQVHPTGAGNFTGDTTALDDAGVIPNATFTDYSLSLLIDATNTGTDIAVFDGRVWTVSGITYQYSATGSTTDFTTVGGGGSFVDRNPDVRIAIQRLVAAAGYLYAIGDHATHSIFGAATFSSGNVAYTDADNVPGIGTIWPETAQLTGSTVVMMSDYGGNVVSGQTAESFTSLLDSLYPKIDTSFTPVACFGKIYNKYVYIVLAYATNPTDGNKAKLLLCFYEDRWFIVTYGLDLTYIQGSQLATDTKVYGAYGNNIVQLFSGTSTLMNRQARTKAKDYDIPQKDKQILNVGATIESLVAFSSSMTATISAVCDNTVYTSQVTFTPSTVIVVNNLGQTVTMTNAAGAVVTISALYSIMNGYKSMDNGGRGKRISIDFSEYSANQYIISGLLVDGNYGADF